MSSLFTTGLPSLDRVLKGVLPGDNIVWQVDAIEDYMAFVAPYAQSALASGRRLVYFRFADHAPLVPAGCGAEVHVLHPERGFEQFIKQIHQVIEGAGRGAFYVFDSLSELAADWYSDQMLGNFFVLTCPYLFDLETVAYFAIFRDRHSFHSIVPISETTQLFLEVYRHKGRLHVHPTKVLHRYSATMNMLHVWEGEEFRPVTSSSVISHIMSAVKWGGLQKERRPGFLERTFLDAQEQLAQIRAGNAPPDAERDLFARLARMVVSRDDGMLELLGKHMNVEDVFEIRRRMIGTGLIGGKTVGMLLARAILRDADPRFADLIEPHDSFFMGSDVFYTFLVRNGAWWMYQKQHDPATFLEGSDQARQRILTGTFPAYTIKQLEEMLDYFGQSPFIVRSSSLLEDNFGNSFAGKYDSVFCANQGPRERRLDDFLAAVRTIYASSMSERALRYRAQRGMLDRDEQMALLIMRVSGSRYGHYFYPPVAGVGFSFNPYVWSRDIDPHAGVVRLVFGLGTRAVNRSDDDYTRIVALNAPERRPEANFDEVRQYTQRRVDCIDLDANQLVSLDFDEVIRHCGDLPLDLLASEDRTAERDGRPPSRNQILTFEPLLQETEFVRDLRDIHRILQDAYAHPVDIEFTANFSDERSHQFNLVQCRPLQAKGGEAVCVDDLHIAQKDRIIAARSARRPGADRRHRPIRVCGACRLRRPAPAAPPRCGDPSWRDQPRPAHRPAGNRYVARAGPLGHKQPGARNPRGLRRHPARRGALRNCRHARGPDPGRLAGHAFPERAGGDGHALHRALPAAGRQLYRLRILRIRAQLAAGARARRGGMGIHRARHRRPACHGRAPREIRGRRARAALRLLLRAGLTPQLRCGCRRSDPLAVAML